jgi:putative transposase
MSWKTSSLLQARLRFVQAARGDGQSVAQVCQDFGISQKTGFKWLRRFRRFGRLGLADRSRAPKSTPHRTDARWLAGIKEQRRKHPSWGAKKIYACLRRSHPRARLPKVRTISKWLGRLEPMRPRPRWAVPGPQLPRPRLTVPRGPNDVWTADYKGHFHTRNGQRVDPLTVRDLYSRFLLGIRLLGFGHDPVRRYFQELFMQYGKPKIIRVDHGVPFAGDGALDLTRLSAWWLRLDIKVEFTRRAHPQDNGAHEQMHRVYKAEVASKPAVTPRGQQARTTRWLEEYNYNRPHEALGQRVPAELYRKSRRPYRPILSELKYPSGWPSRRVAPNGSVRWRGRVRVIGRAFSGQRVGFKATSADQHEIYFGPQLIGWLVEKDKGGLRPAQWSK